MNASRVISWLLFGTLLIAGPASAQNLLVNGSFESPAYSANSVNYPPSVPGWTSTAGFEFWNQFEGPAADGNQYIELDATTCTTISQTIPTSSNSKYNISLAFAPRDGVVYNQIDVLWNGTVIGTASADGGSQSGNVVWTYHTYTAQGGAGSSTLAIRDTDPCNGYGSLLDDVSVAEVPASTPVLGSLGIVLLTGGLLLFALVVLYRAKKILG